MAKPAYIFMNNTGVVERTHTTDIGGNNVVTAGVSDLELLIQQGYQPLREIPLEGGKVLIVLQKPQVNSPHLFQAVNLLTRINGRCQTKRARGITTFLCFSNGNFQ